MKEYDPACGAHFIPPIARDSTYHYPFRLGPDDYTPLVTDDTEWRSYCVTPPRSYHVSPTHGYLVTHDGDCPAHWSA